MGNKLKRGNTTSNASLSTEDLKKKISAQVETAPKTVPEWTEVIRTRWRDRMEYAGSSDVRYYVSQYDNSILVELYRMCIALTNEISFRIRMHQKANPGTLVKEQETVVALLKNLHLDDVRALGYKLPEEATEDSWERWVARIKMFVPDLMNSFSILNSLDKHLTANGVKLCNYNNTKQ